MSLSAMSVMAGEVAVGEIWTTPAGMVAALAAAIVVPDMKAPMMTGTFSILTSLPAASTAALCGAAGVADREHGLAAQQAAAVIDVLDGEIGGVL